MQTRQEVCRMNCWVPRPTLHYTITQKTHQKTNTLPGMKSQRGPSANRQVLFPTEDRWGQPPPPRSSRPLRAEDKIPPAAAAPPLSTPAGPRRAVPATHDDSPRPVGDAGRGEGRTSGQRQRNACWNTGQLVRSQPITDRAGWDVPGGARRGGRSGDGHGDEGRPPRLAVTPGTPVTARRSTLITTTAPRPHLEGRTRSCGRQQRHHPHPHPHPHQHHH
jgi:hypothetical protein